MPATRHMFRVSARSPHPEPSPRRMLPVGAVVAIVLTMVATACEDRPTFDTADIAISLRAGAGPEMDVTADARSGAATIDITGLTEEIVTALRGAGSSDEQWADLLRVTVVMDLESEDSTLPAVLGSHTITEAGALRFTPMFPFDPGRAYTARFDPNGLPGVETEGLQAIEAVVALDAPGIQPTTVVERIFPSGDRIPENQLKLYLHFSAPMSAVDGLEYLTLSDARGREVAAPFLPFGTEFWDRDHLRYTVFFDPGRVKRGLELNERLGRPLEAGETYTLVVDPAWPDAEGNPLQAPFEKRFSVGPADTTPVDHTTWRLRVPSGGSTQRLVVSFPEPLDDALMRHAIWVETAAGHAVGGEVETGNWETRWMMTPTQPWVAGAYALVASMVVEDLAGNQIGTPFEVLSINQSSEGRGDHANDHTSARLEVAPPGDTVRIPFEVR